MRNLPRVSTSISATCLATRAGLALREDDDTRCELQARGNRRQVAEQHEDFMEHAVVRIPTPARPLRGIRPEDVVVREQVPKAHVLHGFGVRADTAWICPNLGLRKNDAELHHASFVRVD